MYDRGDRRQPKLVHCVVSMVMDASLIDEIRPLAVAVAKRHGVLGGASVVHHLRTDKYSVGGDGTTHVHIVGMAVDITEGGDDLDADGNVIIFKHIQDDEYKDHRGFRSERAVKRALQYLLTHCAVIEGKHALTWWGCMGYRNLSRGTIERAFPGALDATERENSPCPVCGGSSTEPCSQRVPVAAYNDEYMLRGPSGFREELVRPEPTYPFGDAHPLSVVWDAVRSVLTADEYGRARHGLAMGDILHYLSGDADVIRRVVRWNLESGRLKKDDAGIITVCKSFGLDQVLSLMWHMTRSGVTPRSGDSALRRLILANCPDAGSDDMSFVFGPVLERFERGCSGVA